MEQGILKKLRKSYDRLTKSEKIVANYVLKHPEEILYASITDFADACGVGDTTIFRFCKALKLNGYQEFKMLLAKDIATQKGTDATVLGAVTKEDDTRTICKKTLSADVEALNETFESIDFSELEKAVDRMTAANRICFFGMGSSGMIAQEAKVKFMRIVPNVECAVDGHLQLMTAALLKKDDVAIVFSYSGATKNSIEIAKMAKENGATVISVTRFPKSHLTGVSDIVLTCGSNEGPLEGGASSTSMVQMYIIDVLYLLYFVRNYETSWEHKSKTTESISKQVL